MKTLSIALAAFALSAGAACAEGQVHHLAFQVDQNDPAVMNLTLNNVENVLQAYADAGDTVQVEVVAYGPGLNMYVQDKSPVAQRLAVIALEHPEVTFSACGNTLKKMEAGAGHEIALVDEAQVVPAGVVRLATLQEEGWSYIRP